MGSLARDVPAADRVADRLGNLDIDPKPPQYVVCGTDSSAIRIERPPAVSRETGASDESQRADSSSELGTKPPSLDGKSITSGTTFALDEKESLRPDDSASVKAAGEDDDSLSVRGSLMAGSRMSSDLAARSRAIQLGDVTDRRSLQPNPGNSGQGILTPQSNSSERQPHDHPEMGPLSTAEGSTDALNLIYRHAPDDKLIEAMSTPKDRMYLLRLEKDVIEFVQNSKYVIFRSSSLSRANHGQGTVHGPPSFQFLLQNAGTQASRLLPHDAFFRAKHRSGTHFPHSLLPSSDVACAVGPGLQPIEQ